MKNKVFCLRLYFFGREDNLLIISMSLSRGAYIRSAQKYSFSPKTSEIRCDTPKSSLITASSSKPMGLPNIGNTCFLNSIIQFLFAAEKFREDLIAKYGGFKEASNGKFGKLLGMIFKSIKENDKRPAALSDQKKILNVMVSKLEEINNEYQRHFQEDAIQTLLNVLNEIQNKHPELTKQFDIEYSSKCKCCQFSVEERMISYSEVKCMKCYTPNQVKLITAPKYIIYSNASKKAPTTTKIQLGETGKGHYTYIQKARIIYIGNGKSGHYMVQREEDKKWFQFSDESVQNVDGKRSHRGNNSHGLILLYELQQAKKDIAQSRNIRSNIHVSNSNDRFNALQASSSIKIEEQTAEMIEQLEKPIQKIPLNWVTKVKIVRKYISYYPNTTLGQHKFVMLKRYSSVCLRTIRRDNQTLKEYSDFNQDYNKMKYSYYQENYLKILAEYLLPRLVERKSSFRIFSMRLQKNPVTEAEKAQLVRTFNSNQDEMFTLNILVTI